MNRVSNVFGMDLFGSSDLANVILLLNQGNARGLGVIGYYNTNISNSVAVRRLSSFIVNSPPPYIIPTNEVVADIVIVVDNTRAMTADNFDTVIFSLRLTCQPLCSGENLASETGQLLSNQSISHPDLSGFLLKPDCWHCNLLKFDVKQRRAAIGDQFDDLPGVVGHQLGSHGSPQFRQLDCFDLSQRPPP
jgi:hypothetical protein